MMTDQERILPIMDGKSPDRIPWIPRMGDAFILGVADNATAMAKLSRVIRVGEMVEEYGKYPIEV